MVEQEEDLKHDIEEVEGIDKEKCCDGEDRSEEEEEEKKEEISLSYAWKTLRQCKNWIAVLVPLAGMIVFLFSTLVDIILFNAIPTADGEYRFRDIRHLSTDVSWKIFNSTHGDAWKKHVSAHPTTPGTDAPDLGHYELATATVFVQSRGHSKRSPPLGPVDSRFVSFILRMENKSNVYFTLEKVSEAPEVVKMVVGGDDSHHGGIYAQISDSRDASLRSMNDGYKRRHLDIGTVRWRARAGSLVTLDRFLSYYTQTSAHLAPGYNYYSRNCQHFVVAVVKLLKQLQDFDLGGEAVTGDADKI